MTSPIDTDAFINAAYVAHAARLQDRLARITRDPLAAEDLVQEAFVRLLLELRAGRAPENAGAWLYRVAYNLAMSLGRRRAVAGRRQDELPVPCDAPSPEALVLETEQQAWLRDAVAELPVTDRRAIILSASGFGGPEIARSIGRSDAATRTLLCRARSKLRSRMLHAVAG